MLKELSGRLVRACAPRSVAALEEVAQLRADLATLAARHQELGELHRELARRSQQVTDQLERAIAELQDEVRESRSMSLRVGQLTDLVFERLADSSPRA